MPLKKTRLKLALKQNNMFKKLSYNEAMAKVRAKVKTRSQKPQNAPKRIKKEKVKKVSLSKLMKKADAIFSQFIRIRDNGKCYTCGLQKSYKEMQNGHFVPRQYKSLRYDEVNCHCQCYACNMLYNGQPSAYAKRLEEDYGVGTVSRLESKRKDICLWREPEYNALIDKYTAKVIELTQKS